MNHENCVLSEGFCCGSCLAVQHPALTNYVGSEEERRFASWMRDQAKQRLLWDFGLTLSRDESYRKLQISV